jgi:single-strand DNA-binding protein
MSSINKVILVGHLGEDPELRTLDGGIPVASFPLVTSEFYHKNGGRVEHTEWHNIIMWRTKAEVAHKILRKGKLVYIEAKLHTRFFHDKQGIKRYTTEVIAVNFNALGLRDEFFANEPDNKISRIRWQWPLGFHI